jgi:hypothetical protein
MIFISLLLAFLPVADVGTGPGRSLGCRVIKSVGNWLS